MAAVAGKTVGFGYKKVKETAHETIFPDMAGSYHKTSIQVMFK
jgi:hypothetical protein